MSENYRPQQEEPEIISTSQAVNLTSTIASLSALFALFFCFADQRSRAVRRFSVQSVGLGAIHLLLGMVIWILCEVLGWIPLIGSVLPGEERFPDMSDPYDVALRARARDVRG